jgi:cytochrome P450
MAFGFGLQGGEMFRPTIPTPRGGKAGLWTLFATTRDSWLDVLYERSYSMTMGHVRLPGIPLFMVNAPHLVREVLLDRVADFPKHRVMVEVLRPLLGESIFTTNGDVWARQRRLMEPAFKEARVRTVFDRMVSATRRMTDQLDRACEEGGGQHDQDGAPFAAEAEMSLVTADIIFRTILSESLDSQTAQRIFAAFSRYQVLAPRLALHALYGIPKWVLPSTAVREANECANTIRTALHECIVPRMDGQSPAQQDLLQALMEARDEQTGSGLSKEELVDQVAMLFLAGHETSASALGWALHLLAHDADSQDRLRDEVCALVGDAPIQFEHLGQLSYATACFKEALRLFPPVGFLPRESACPQGLHDKTMPKGAAVMVSPWLMHRHRKHWQEPDGFWPERFLKSAPVACQQSIRQAYLPFGLGPRICIGAGFALQEAVLILATLVRRYRFLPQPGFVPQPVGRLTIRSRNGIALRIQRWGCKGL